MDDYLQQGILAAKAGDKPRAFDLLTRASEVPATSEKAWLWLSSVVNDDSERLFCLNNVLRINSNNDVAKRGAEMLRQKGIFPAVPVYPAPQKAAPLQGFTSKPASAPTSSQTNFVASTWAQTESAPAAKFTPKQPGYETDWKKQELSGLFQYAVMELANKKPRQMVEKLLVGRGASPEVAKTVVQDAQYVVRKTLREKYKKRMTRGLLWTIVGVAITCGTLAFSDSLGGKYVLFYGAIIFGFIDFVAGLVGWLANG
jgi:hypothetical protein